MHQNNIRSKTQHSVDKQIEKALNMAAQQKMLPKIIYDTYLSTKRDPVLKQYKKSVKRMYTKQTHLPLKYNPQEARSHRQKFRQKVLKLINHELPIQYLKTEKVKGNNVMTYQGYPLQEKKYLPKKQYSIFADFNENKFKKGFSDFFDDKLVYDHKNVLTNQTQQKIASKNRTCPNEDAVYKVKKYTTQKNITPTNTNKKQVQYSLPKLVTGQKLFSKPNKMLCLSPHIDKKPPIKILTENQDEQILQRMKKIGNYHPHTTISNISLTKQSIVKYFREIYQRPHRIIDFLEIDSVENFVTFKAIPQRLKFMPKDHVDFMTFLFYDTNNDGIICDRDLLRVFELVKKCPLIQQDYTKLKKNALKVYTQATPNYKQIYKLPQITETAYFTWKNKKQETQAVQQSDELKQFLKKINQQKIRIDFKGFQKIYKNDKPFLWYDIMWRIGGLVYQGLQYQ